jgi:hypothetical protein
MAVLAAFCVVLVLGAPAHTQPRIEFRELEYDWGEMMEGDTITHDFVFRNTGKDVLVIEKVKSG